MTNGTTWRTARARTSTRRRVRTWAVCAIAGLVLAGAGLGCATKWIRIGKPRRPPVAGLEVVRQLEAFERAGVLRDGDPLILYLHEVQSFADYVMELRGEPYLEADEIAR